MNVVAEKEKEKEREKERGERELKLLRKMDVPESDKTPVLHRAHFEVWNSHQV